MYTLYTIPGSCSSGITTLMEKLGIEYTTVKRDDVENYTSIVPTNQVPALKVGEQIITEGAAIALYLLEKHAPEQLPSSEAQRTVFNQWLMFDYATLHPAYAKLFTAATKLSIGEAEKPAVLQELGDQISSLWNILDNHLEGKTFITGDEANIIDYLAVIYSSWGNYFPQVSIVFGSNVKRLIASVSALPEFTAAYASEGIEFASAA